MATDYDIDAAIRKYGAYPNRIWYLHPDGSITPADGGAPLADAGAPYVAIVHSVRDWGAELKGQPQGEPLVDLIQGEIGTVDCGFRIVTEVELKTCQHCKHWDGKCNNADVNGMLDADSWRAFEPPADFGCNHWGQK